MKNFFTLLVLFVSVNLLANKSPNIKVQAYRTNSSLSIDGLLTEQVYKNKPVTNFVQKIPDEGKPATEECRCHAEKRRPAVRHCTRQQGDQRSGDP